ncbi:MAG: HAD family hydrolase [Usitatibacteraceae bacterium]
MNERRDSRLALFDLDNTLLTGDSDTLWCDFLVAQGRLDASTFAAANADMEQRYRAGRASAEEFCHFYVSLLRGISRVEGEVLRQQFFVDWIRPRIPDDARALVEKHRSLGDELILTTATNRFITELTAREFGIDNLIAIETECIDGIFTGEPLGVLNMRDGKVVRLKLWLEERRWPLELLNEATFYSDSINDLPLLLSVGNPIAVDPDAKLAREVAARGWPTILLSRVPNFGEKHVPRSD